jgi:Fe-S-cluster-containing dehydrogenase component
MPSIERIQVEARFCTTPGTYILAVALTPDGESKPALSRHVLTRTLPAYAFSILVCQHCLTPTCVAACPSRAMHVDPRGVLMLVDDDCLRCGGCEASCPHHAIFTNRPADRTIRCQLSLDNIQAPSRVEVRPCEAFTLSLELRPREY